MCVVARKGGTNTDQTKEGVAAGGAWLKETRKSAGLTQFAMGKALDFDYFTHVSQIEGGRSRLQTANYRKWAEMVGMDSRQFTRKLLSFYEPDLYDLLFEDGE
jgi:hypothetical protein